MVPLLPAVMARRVELEKVPNNRMVSEGRFRASKCRVGECLAIGGAGGLK